MQDSISQQRIAAKYQSLSGLMDERMSRQWAAAEAAAYGWGGVRAVSAAAGVARRAARPPHHAEGGGRGGGGRGAPPGAPIPTRIRRPGGGRKCCTESDP